MINSKLDEEICDGHYVKSDFRLDSCSLDESGEDDDTRMLTE